MARRRVAVLACVVASFGFAGDWPAWRGPSGMGIGTNETPPTKWSKTEHVRWKFKLDGPGNSTPILIGDKLFLTHAPASGGRRSLICLNALTGELQWKQEVEYSEKEATHATNPFCSSSPVSDGERVVVWHGSAGLFCYDLDGAEKWRLDLGKFDHIWGTASSPVIVDDLVVLNAGPGLSAFVAAFEKRSGKEVWRKEFPEMKSLKQEEFRGSWSTPVVYDEEGRKAVLLSLPGTLWSVEPQTGEVIWSCGGLSKLVYTSPLVDQGIVVAMSGFHGPALGVKTGGKGDVTESHRLWRLDQKIPQRVGTGVLVDGQVYLLSENGVLTCTTAATGELKWERRLGGTSWSSLSYVNGLLYAPTMNGTTFVLKPHPTGVEIVAENPLNEITRASQAFCKTRIYVRTYDYLYCLSE